MPQYPPTTPTPTTPTAHTTPPVSPRDAPRSSKTPNDWLGALLGVVLVGYGIYVIVQSSGTSYLGPFLVLLGVAFQPWAIVSVVGGVGLLIWAAWWTFFKAIGPMDYLYSVVAAIVGVGSILERWGRAKRRGSGG